MNIVKDIEAVESLAERLKTIQPEKLIDIGIRFMASARKRLEDGEKRIEELLGTVSGQAAMIDDLKAQVSDAVTKLGHVSEALAKIGGVDLSGLAAEAEAMVGKGSTQPSSVKDLVAQAVPGADPAHIAAAVDAHDAARSDGASADDAATKAMGAALRAGASQGVAMDIAKAITWPADAPKPAQTDPAPQPQPQTPAEVVQAAVPDADPAHVDEAVAVHAASIAEGTSHDDAKVAAEVAALDAGASEEHAKAIAAAIPAPADAPAADAPAADAPPRGTTTLADGTVLGG